MSFGSLVLIGRFAGALVLFGFVTFFWNTCMTIVVESGLKRPAWCPWFTGGYAVALGSIVGHAGATSAAAAAMRATSPGLAAAAIGLTVLAGLVGILTGGYHHLGPRSVALSTGGCAAAFVIASVLFA